MKLFNVALLLAALAVSRMTLADDPPNPGEKDAREFVRRMMIDLNGRAPTDKELEDFISKPSPDGYRKEIDRLRAQEKSDRLKLDIDSQVKLGLDRQAREMEDATRLLQAQFAYADALGAVNWWAKSTVAYMGVGVEAPSETLRAQLRLPEGLGLVVNYVDADGPSKDLIHPHDVLERIDDQMLVNGEQFAALIHMHKNGEQVTVSVIREAKPLRITVTLGEKKPPQPDPQPKADAGATSTINFSDWAVNKNGLLSLSRTGPVTIDDGAYTAVLQQAGDHNGITVLDKSTGKVVFSGPVQDQQQWSNLPEALRARLSAWRALAPVIDPAQSVQGDPLSASRDAYWATYLAGTRPLILSTTQPAEKK